MRENLDSLNALGFVASQGENIEEHMFHVIFWFVFMDLARVFIVEAINLGSDIRPVCVIVCAAVMITIILLMTYILRNQCHFISCRIFFYLLYFFLVPSNYRAA